MKKDYLIADQQASSTEAEFVEDFWSKIWDRVADLPPPVSVTKREEYRLMLPFLERLPQGSKILDGGCGLGEWTDFFASQGYKALGLDLSERTVARLREIRPHTEFVRGDIRQTGFPDGSFDAYFSWGAFEHFENGPGDCIAEAYRILKPGGILFISVPYQNWRLILREASPRYRWSQSFKGNPGDVLPTRFYQWRFTRADLRQELEMRGFSVKKIRAIHKQEGLRRTLMWDFGLPPEKLVSRAVVRLFRGFFPSFVVSHMLMAVAVRSAHPGPATVQHRSVIAETTRKQSAAKP